jgi:hypothetical protein
MLVSGFHNSDSMPADSGVDSSAPQAQWPLQACGSCEAVLDVSECEPLDCFRCPQCGAVVEVSGQIDRFIAVDVAGRGGMGVVYKAYDSSLDRYVALKLLRKDHSADAKLIEQLETEAAITASINDPHVVRVYGTGRDRGRFFIAMELVDKGSLDDLIKLQGRVAESQVLEVGIQVAKGLKAAQQHGLIHRDVKPGNVLFGEGRAAKIVDFGLAVFQNEEEKVRGEVWGTPYYVAPEKLDNQPEDFRSDMYSLGGTLFHALAGRPPFEAENASLVALKHLKSQAVSLQSFAPWVSSATAHIINRTLHKNAAQRFQSYDELIQNLEYAREQLGQHGTAPVQRARVVLETEEDQKNYLWVTLGMIAAAVLLVVGFFVFRGKLEKEVAGPARGVLPAAGGSKKAASDLGDQLKEGIQLLVDGKAEAVAWFQGLGARNPQADMKAWGRIGAGLALLEQGKASEAHGEFAGLASLVSEVKNPKLSAVCAVLTERLTQPAVVPAGELSQLDANGLEGITLLACGLHNWTLGNTAEGVAVLRAFRKQRPEGDTAWIGDLKPLAMAKIEAFSKFEMLVQEYNASTNKQFRIERMGQMTALGSPFAQQIALLSKPDDVPPMPDGGQMAVFEPGIYRIKNVRAGRVLDAEISGDGRMLIYDDAGTDNQLWELRRQEDGSYSIVSVAFNKALDVPHSRAEEDLAVQLWGINATNAQRWNILHSGAGSYLIVSKASGMVLDVKGVDNGAGVKQKTDDGGDDKRWTIDRVR